jgi:Zn-dependent M28 family amino/carboxypeptidase
MKFIVLLIITTALAVSSFAQPAAAPKADIFSTKEAVEASIKDVPCERADRLEGVRKLFLAAGAAEADIKIEKFDKDKISNVVVRKKGETDETIVIGAHYDRTDAGCGVTDNWSGVTIMSHIYKTLKPLITKKSYVFVAFDQEERGLKGSSQMLKAMPDAEVEKICSMVNFDSFGQANPMALKNASSPKMLKLAEGLGKDNGFRFNSVEIEGASSDSATFHNRKIPAITLSGLASNWMEILHSSSDKLDKVNIDSVYFGYRFGVVFISKLEAAACNEYRQ